MISGRVVRLLAVLIATTVSGVARADYVDFSAGFDATTEPIRFAVNGVTVTVRSTDGPLWGNPWIGFMGLAEKQRDAAGTRVVAQGIVVSFSEPVRVEFADLVDYGRGNWSGCSGVSCDVGAPITGETLTCSANERSSLSFGPTAPASAVVDFQSGIENGGSTSYGERRSGWSKVGTSGAVAEYAITPTLKDKTTELVFAAKLPDIVAPANAIESTAYNYFALRGIEFKRIGKGHSSR